MAITQSINQNVQNAIAEMTEAHKERHTVVKNLWVGLIGQLHVLLIGPGGTGKSFVCRDLTKRITGATYFEVALDETTDPSQVFGPPDIKAMVEDGKTRRITTGMLPDADVAYFDEYFNANTPMLHSLRPPLNERLFHNNGTPIRIPLRMAVMGTNKLSADVDHAPDWDRIHIRDEVRYVADRQNRSDLVRDSILRKSRTFQEPTRSTISVEELDIAYEEAIRLHIPEPVEEMFYDIQEELEGEVGVVVSTRRVVEGMAGVLANAWVNGHDEVKTGDLDILASMWWVTLDQRDAVRQTILQAVNPGEKEALDMLNELDEQKRELNGVADLDPVKRSAQALQVHRNVKSIAARAGELMNKATEAGTGTARIQELVEKCQNTMNTIEQDIFGV